jgi:Fe-S cluster assembly protein SufB
MAPWVAVNMPDIDFDNTYFYLKPAGRQVDEWDELPAQMPATSEKPGISEPERKCLPGVTAQHTIPRSSTTANREDLEAQGILFCDMDTALDEYPGARPLHFGQHRRAGDNEFAALNSAVWSGGSFIYVPPGVKCELPLRAYFRINFQSPASSSAPSSSPTKAPIEGSPVPVYTTDSLHSATMTRVRSAGR